MAAYNIKLRLDDFRPLTWRDLIIPTGITFKELHDIIQITMGFLGYHLYNFSFKDSKKEIVDFEIRDSVMSEMFGIEELDSNKTLIDPYFNHYKKINYLYDFGDSWSFTIEIKGTIEYDEEYPKLVRLKGEYNPVEDCGGVYGLSKLIYYKENPEEEIEEHLEGMLEELEKCDKDLINSRFEDFKKGLFK